MRPPKLTNTRAKAATIHNPLGAYPEQFRKHLESEHFSPATIAQYERCLNVLGSQMSALNIDLKDLDENRAVELIARPEQQSYRRKHNAFIIRSFIKFLIGLGSVSPVLAALPDDTLRGRLKRDYEQYLRRQRGLSERTIFHSCLLYTSPSPRDGLLSRMPSSA